MNYRNILLIDDDEDDQEIFLTALRKVSADVLCTALDDASKALQQLREKHLDPDVIFLDLNMPIMNGLQFLGEIKKDATLRSIPVVIFSTSSHPPTISLAHELGAMRFITKPDRFSDLIDILASFLS